MLPWRVSLGFVFEVSLARCMRWYNCNSHFSAPGANNGSCSLCFCYFSFLTQSQLRTLSSSTSHSFPVQYSDFHAYISLSWWKGAPSEFPTRRKVKSFFRMSESGAFKFTLASWRNSPDIPQKSVLRKERRMPTRAVGLVMLSRSLMTSVSWCRREIHASQYHIDRGMIELSAMRMQWTNREQVLVSQLQVEM